MSFQDDLIINPEYDDELTRGVIALIDLFPEAEFQGLERKSEVLFAILCRGLQIYVESWVKNTDPTQPESIGDMLSTEMLLAAPDLAAHERGPFVAKLELTLTALAENLDPM